MRKQSRTSSSPKESMEVFWVCFCLKEMVQNVLAIPAFPRLQSEGSLRCHALKGKESRHTGKTEHEKNRCRPEH